MSEPTTKPTELQKPSEIPKPSGLRPPSKISRQCCTPKPPLPPVSPSSAASKFYINFYFNLIVLCFY